MLEVLEETVLDKNVDDKKEVVSVVVVIPDVVAELKGMALEREDKAEVGREEVLESTEIEDTEELLVRPDEIDADRVLGMALEEVGAPEVAEKVVDEERVEEKPDNEPVPGVEVVENVLVVAKEIELLDRLDVAVVEVAGATLDVLLGNADDIEGPPLGPAVEEVLDDKEAGKELLDDCKLLESVADVDKIVLKEPEEVWVDRRLVMGDEGMKGGELVAVPEDTTVLVKLLLMEVMVNEDVRVLKVLDEIDVLVLESAVVDNEPEVELRAEDPDVDAPGKLTELVAGTDKLPALVVEDPDDITPVKLLEPLEGANEVLALGTEDPDEYNPVELIELVGEINKLLALGAEDPDGDVPGEPTEPLEATDELLALVV